MIGAVIALSLRPSPGAAESREHPWVAILGAAAAAARDDWATARARLTVVPEKTRPAEVTAALALSHLASGQVGKARPLLAAALAAQPTLGEAHYWRAVAALRAGALVEAEAALDLAVSIDAGRPEVWLLRALARAARGDRRRAVDDVIAAARLEPNLLEPSYHPDERRGVLRLAELGLRRYPVQGTVEETAALLLLEAGLLREAERRVAGDRSAIAFEVRGRIALRRGHPDQALGLLERAVSESPSARPRFHLARAAYRQGALAKALAALREAARRDPTDPRTQTALGDLALEQGDLEGAELAYGYALAQETSVPALTGLARSLELQGDLEGAGRGYRRALALAPAAVEPLERLSRLLERRPEPDDLEIRRLRRRLAEASALEREVNARVEAFQKVAAAHQATCALIARDPAAALKKLGGADSGVAPAARALGAVAAHEKAGSPEQARASALLVLRALSSKGWARGARPLVVVRRQIDRVLVVRSVDVEFVPLEGRGGR